ncbi:phosphatidate cytidylyltransferase [bacterium]|nr:phosphatidate cytidylyltransferase [bacterium]
MSSAPPSNGSSRRDTAWRRFVGADIVPRLLVILVAVPLVIWAALQGGLIFRLLVGVIILLGLREFALLMEAKGYGPSRVLCVAAGVCFAWTGASGGGRLPLLLTLVTALAVIIELFRREMREPLAKAGVTVFGAMYVGWLGSFMVQLRELPPPPGADYDLGLRALGLMAAITWCYDTAAYLVGVAAGSRPLFARISPRKSLEGALGGAAAAVAAGVAASATFAPFVTTLQGALIGLGGAVLAQAGDLVESLLKRDAGLKDTAGLLPGHGGVLDRMDSVLFTAPFIYYVVAHLTAN